MTIWPKVKDDLNKDLCCHSNTIPVIDLLVTKSYQMRNFQISLHDPLISCIEHNPYIFLLRCLYEGIHSCSLLACAHSLAWCQDTAMFYCTLPHQGLDRVATRESREKVSILDLRLLDIEEERVALTSFSDCFQLLTKQDGRKEG